MNFLYWKKLGRIIQPSEDIIWMSTYSGAACALQIDDTPLFDVYVTGRDTQNRSQIGRFRINIEQPSTILELTRQPVLSFGELGAFDENGVSYPYIVSHQNQLFLYYVGWMPTVLTPFNLQIGLATLGKNGQFRRVSRAPILPRNDADFLSTGSCCVLIDNGLWKMWYTSFLRWGKTANAHKHDYVIKYATSQDGIHWQRDNQICIDIEHPSEYAICRPTVIKRAADDYIMWYTYRGAAYRIGFAHSTDGIHWQRQDDLAGIDIAASPTDWDGQSLCYPFVFPYQKKWYMLYNGNDYGKTGLGIAVLEGEI